MPARFICENGGCLSKLHGIDMKSLISTAVHSSGARIMDIPEDCAELSLDKGRYLFSTDFGLLVGYDYLVAGEVAALNAISDIFAMGGTPIAALVMTSVTNQMTQGERNALLSGIFKVCARENIIVLGGHTVVSDAPMAGLSVIGKPNGGRIITKKGSIVGDKIWITKKIGTGLALRGYSNDLIGESGYQEAIDTMLYPSKIPDEILRTNCIHAMTDLTGFGLLGHLSEMLNSTLGADIYLDRIPILKSLEHLSPYGMNSDYIIANKEYACDNCKLDNLWEDSIIELALFDPQTNGGMIIVVDRNTNLEEYGYYCIGKITSAPLLRGVLRSN